MEVKAALTKEDGQEWGGKEGHLNVPGCNSAYPRVQARCQDSKRIFGSGTLVRDQAEDEQVTVCMFGICES